MKQPTDKDMIAALKALYNHPDFRKLNMWPATRDWLREHLPAAKKALVPD
jgi:hypothetical protein